MKGNSSLHYSLKGQILSRKQVSIFINVTCWSFLVFALKEALLRCFHMHVFTLCVINRLIPGVQIQLQHSVRPALKQWKKALKQKIKVSFADLTCPFYFDPEEARS